MCFFYKLSRIIHNATCRSSTSTTMEDMTKTIMFTTNPMPNGQTSTIQYQQSADGTIKPKLEKSNNQQEFPTFCYTTNVSAVLTDMAVASIICFLFNHHLL